MISEVVGYTERLEPNPAMHISEGTLYPTTRDGMYEIHQDPIYKDVPRNVPDEKRASAAAAALVALALSDERHIRLAGELMGKQDVFAPYWESLCRLGPSRRTKRIALRRLGRAPSQLFLKNMLALAEALKGPLESLCYVCTAAFFCGLLIYVYWPDSQAGLWIAATVKRILAEAARIIYN